MIFLADRIEMDDANVRETRDGYLVANALTARTGIQTYTAGELKLADRDPRAIVRVYRPPAAVFDAKALASMAFRPMTNDHPSEAVTAENWKKLSIGNAGGDVVRDGSGVRVPLVMMDAAAIRDFRAGKRELSWGYTCDITMQDGVVPQGEPDAGMAYDAVQSDIQANHIALCDKARGGEKLTFGDHQETPTVKTIIVDGFSVEVTDAAERAILTLQGKLSDQVKLTETAQAKAGELAGTLAVRDGELAAAKTMAEDAKITPDKLAALVADRTALETSAKPFLGDAYDFKGKTDVDIRRAVVATKVGDKAATMDEATLAGAFSVIAADAPTDVSDGVRQAVKDGGLTVADAEKIAADARNEMIAELKGKKKKAA